MNCIHFLDVIEMTEPVAELLFYCKHALNPVQIVNPENLSTVEDICVDLKIHSHPRILCIYRHQTVLSNTMKRCVM